jgi:TonB family protein
MKARVAEVGAFEEHDSIVARPGSDRSAGRVLSSGFENVDAPSTTARNTHAVTSSGFGAADVQPPSTTARNGRAVSGTGFGAADVRPASTPEKREVKAVGFGDAPPSQATAAAKPKADPTFIPVEVLFKPTPAYSEEARSLRIQGEVTLEVDFCATGQIRVVRVVRGLGHGLDDLAARAAEQIRFKPAQSGGRPMDFRANLQIVFRLT